MGKRKIMILPTTMLSKSVNQMGKLLGKWDNSKRSAKRFQINDAPPVAFSGSPTFVANQRYLNTKHVTRRQIVLNRHFTEIISDVLANNDLNKQLNDIGVSVTCIESKIWMKGIDIFYTTDSGQIPDLENLDSFKSQMVTAIANRGMIGRVPRVNFVFDEHEELSKKLEEVMKVSSNTTRIEKPRDLAIKIDSSVIEQKKQNWMNSMQDDFRKFSAPPDMTNTCFGLNYQELYDKVGFKLKSGRGESERRFSAVNQPLPPAEFHGGGFVHQPKEEKNEDTLDPVIRLKLMKKFIIRQRKKNQYTARLTRKQQLIHRDSITWELPEDVSKKDDDLLEEEECNNFASERDSRS